MRRHHMVFDTRTGKLEERPCDQSDNFDPMQMLHDCPECSAALARGEKPTVRVCDPRTGKWFTVEEAPLGPDGQTDRSKMGPDDELVTAEELAARMCWTEPAPRRASIFDRRRRWRDVKRRR